MVGWCEILTYLFIAEINVCTIQRDSCFWSLLRRPMLTFKRSWRLVTLSKDCWPSLKRRKAFLEESLSKTVSHWHITCCVTTSPIRYAIYENRNRDGCGTWNTDPPVRLGYRTTSERPVVFNRSLGCWDMLEIAMLSTYLIHLRIGHRRKSQTQYWSFNWFAFSLNQQGSTQP